MFRIDLGAAAACCCCCGHRHGDKVKPARVCIIRRDQSRIPSLIAHTFAFYTFQLSAAASVSLPASSCPARSHTRVLLFTLLPNGSQRLGQKLELLTKCTRFSVVDCCIVSTSSMARPFILSAAACVAGALGSFQYLHLDNKNTSAPAKKLLIIGSGSAGLAIAHQINNKVSSGDAAPCQITIVDPSPTHYYQPLWTLVGAALSDRKDSVRPLAPLLPAGVAHVQAAASAFDPGSNTVSLSNGTRWRHTKRNLSHNQPGTVQQRH